VKFTDEQKRTWAEAFLAGLKTPDEARDERPHPHGVLGDLPFDDERNRPKGEADGAE
jgi:hypothetical protein